MIRWSIDRSIETIILAEHWAFGVSEAGLTSWIGIWIPRITCRIIVDHFAWSGTIPVVRAAPFVADEWITIHQLYDFRIGIGFLLSTICWSIWRGWILRLKLEGVAWAGEQGSSGKDGVEHIFDFINYNSLGDGSLYMVGRGSYFNFLLFYFQSQQFFDIRVSTFAI